MTAFREQSSRAQLSAAPLKVFGSKLDAPPHGIEFVETGGDNDGQVASERVDLQHFEHLKAVQAGHLNIQHQELAQEQQTALSGSRYFKPPALPEVSDIYVKCHIASFTIAP